MLMQLMFLATVMIKMIIGADDSDSSDDNDDVDGNEVRLHRVIGYLAEYKDLELNCKVTDL